MYLYIIQDDYLTEWEVMKLRNVFWEKWIQSSVIPIALWAVFYKLSNRMFGIYIERPVFFRPLRFYASFGLSICAWITMNLYIWPSR